MKKNSLKEFFNGKGFYVTLIAAVSIVLVLAVVLSLSTPPVEPDIASNVQNGIGQVAQETVQPYTPSLAKAGDAKGSPSDVYNIASADNGSTTVGSPSNEVGTPSFAGDSGTPSQAVMSGPRTITDEEALGGGTQLEASEDATAKKSDESAKPDVEKPAEAAPKEEAKKEEPKKEEPKEQKPTASEDATEEPEVVTTFVSYTAQSAMEWPLEGEIVMEYSADTAIFNPTLHLYKTNDGISIAGAAGTQVKAAAAGEVIDIFYNEDAGHSIVVDHGNGWKTTYSQLQENVLVNQGQIVTQGQVIGGVEKPTRSSILLGDHLDFSITKDDTTQNPLVVLAK